MLVNEAELRSLFNSLDLNKNGVLTRGELITALRVKARKEGGTSEFAFADFKDIDEAIEFFDKSDADHNKEITFDEFTKTFSTR
ncbi:MULTISPECIES: EF-hand domain-containing protein [unclassified Streptomyces]|uniref:EF-hand domain-containing protein n=1 Tax=unclassified Streptomyces TaxID=2593676 RepID=UPI002E2B7C7F|nr:EF-hand domain-containing protein [Streptomyces sp. NBC_01429]